MSRLDAAIENLYTAFADVRRPQTSEGCPCCWSSEETRSLLRGRLLSDVPVDLLRVYAWSAMLTIGSAADYLYFLPRILDLIARENDEGIDVDVVARAIHATEPHTWTANKRQALEEYLSAVMHTLLAPSRHREIGPWLFVIAQIGFDVRPHLHALEGSTDAILEYFTENASDLPHRRLSQSHMRTFPHAGHDAIVTWFYSPRIRKIIFDAYGYVMPLGESVRHVE